MAVFFLQPNGVGHRAPKWSMEPKRRRRPWLPAHRLSTSTFFLREIRAPCAFAPKIFTAFQILWAYEDQNAMQCEGEEDFALGGMDSSAKAVLPIKALTFWAHLLVRDCPAAALFPFQIQSFPRTICSPVKKCNKSMNPMTGNNTAQLDLLLQAAFNSLLSSGQMQPPMATAKPMKLLELAMALENQRRAAVFPKWPLAELALAQPIPMQLPTMLPTCTPPDFHSRLMATFPSPIAFHGQTSIQEGLADSAIPSPSDTSGSSSQDDRQCRAHNGRGNGRTHRLSYPREFKLIVLHSFWANGQNKYRTCKEFQITKSMLNGWLQKADKIRNSRPGSLKSGRSGRRPQFPGIESQLFELFRAQLAKGERISNKWIRANARRLAGETNAGNDRNCAAATVNDDGATAQCQFSERWLNNFKRRFGIQTGPKDGELMLPEGVPLTVECTGETSAVNNATIQDVDESSDANCQTPPLVDAMSEANWAKIGREICASANGCGQLPIQAFFARFPKIVSGQQGVEQ